MWVQLPLAKSENLFFEPLFVSRSMKVFKGLDFNHQRGVLYQIISIDQLGLLAREFGHKNTILSLISLILMPILFIGLYFQYRQFWA